jgi:hypothetical protein
MPRWTRILILPILINFLFLIPGGVQTWARAQSGVKPRFTSVEVDLLPEYDRQSMLVVCTYMLSSEVTFPLNLELLIPRSTGRPNLVTAGASVDDLFDVSYVLHNRGEWTSILLKSSQPIIHIEYYDSNLSINGFNRHYEYVWESDYDVDNFYVQIQQAYGATNLLVSPVSKNGVWTSDGVLRYFNSEFEKIHAGERLTLNLEYSKKSNQTSVDALQVKPVVPITSNTPGRTAWWDSISWLLILVVAFVLILISSFWLWQINLRQLIRSRISKGSKKEKRISAGVKTEEVQTLGEIHCHLCGKRVNPGDHFCRSCGTHLHIEY